MTKTELTEEGCVVGPLTIAEGAPVSVKRSCGHVEQVQWQLDVDAGSDWLCYKCQTIKEHMLGIQQHWGE